MRRLVLAAVTVLALVGCSDPPSEGIVKDKGHTASWVQLVPSCYNSKGVPTCQIPITHPERWSLKICADNMRADDCGWVTVGVAEWDSTEIGSRWEAADDE